MYQGTFQKHVEGEKLSWRTVWKTYFMTVYIINGYLWAFCKN